MIYTYTHFAAMSNDVPLPSTTDSYIWQIFPAWDTTKSTTVTDTPNIYSNVKHTLFNLLKDK